MQVGEVPASVQDPDSVEPHPVACFEPTQGESFAANRVGRQRLRICQDLPLATSLLRIAGDTATVVTADGAGSDWVRGRPGRAVATGDGHAAARGGGLAWLRQGFGDRSGGHQPN